MTTKTNPFVPAIVAALLAALPAGCALFSGPSDRFATSLYSMAENDSFDVKVYDLDGDSPSVVNAANTLFPRTKWLSTSFGMQVPDRLRVDWTYDGDQHSETFEAAAQMPGGKLYRGEVVVLIEGKNARIGWLDCSRVAWEDLGDCPVGGVLAEPPYAGKDIFDNTGRPFVNGRQL